MAHSTGSTTKMKITATAVFTSQGYLNRPLRHLDRIPPWPSLLCHDPILSRHGDHAISAAVQRAAAIAAFHFWPKRVSLPISVNPPTCGNGITRHPHEGGDGAERGAKLGATARKPWGKGSSGSIGRSKVQLDQTEVSSAVGAR